MAGSVPKSSNQVEVLNQDFPDFDTIFQDLRDWEDQLQDVDFDALEKSTDNGSSSELKSNQPITPKRGGPTPC